MRLTHGQLARIEKVAEARFLKQLTGQLREDLPEAPSLATQQLAKSFVRAVVEYAGGLGIVAPTSVTRLAHLTLEFDLEFPLPSHLAAVMMATRHSEGARLDFLSAHLRLGTQRLRPITDDSIGDVQLVGDQ